MLLVDLTGMADIRDVAGRVLSLGEGVVKGFVGVLKHAG